MVSNPRIELGFPQPQCGVLTTVFLRGEIRTRPMTPWFRGYPPHACLVMYIVLFSLLLVSYAPFSALPLASTHLLCDLVIVNTFPVHAQRLRRAQIPASCT